MNGRGTSTFLQADRGAPDVRHDDQVGPWRAQGVGAIVTLLVLVASTVAVAWLVGALWAVLATAVVVPIALIACLGLDVAGTLLVAAGMFCAPFVSLKPITPPPVVTYADVLFVVGFLLLAPGLLRKPLRVPAPFLAGSLVVLCFGLVSITIHPDVAHSVSGVLRLAYEAITLPLLFRWWNPSPSRITLLATCYLLGNLSSLGYGLVNGPREDGRYMGLAPHPNGFGISLALALALVPYLASRARGQRLLLYCGATFGVYGVWLSGSRAALTVLVLLVVLYLVIERSAGALMLLLVGGLVLATSWSQLAAGSNGFARLVGTTGATQSDEQRSSLLSSGLDEINAHPLLGAGFSQIRVAHNIYVQVAAAIGVVALVGFVTMLVWLLLPLFTAPRPLHRLAYPALAYVLVGPLTDTLADTSMWAAVSLAMLALPERKQNEHPGTGAPCGAPRPPDDGALRQPDAAPRVRNPRQAARRRRRSRLPKW